MKKMNVVTSCRSLALSISALVLLAGPYSSAEEKTASDVRAPVAVYSARETATFIALTKETLDALAASQSTEMVAKLTDLETAWDDAENALKPRDETTWMLLDKTLDKAISALRSSRTNLSKGKSALEDLLKKLQQATKP